MHACTQGSASVAGGLGQMTAASYTARAMLEVSSRNPTPRASGGSRRTRILGVLCCGAALSWLACSPPEGETPVERGARIYRSNCVICHNTDPRLDGTVGPAVAGSSRALVEARVLRASYPEGYAPKRDTKLMPAVPSLAREIDALAAYLGSLER